MSRASMTDTSYTPDNLVLGEVDGEKQTVLSGQSVVRGEVVGRVTKDTTVTVTPGVGNTGDGVMGAVTLGQKALVGDYLLTCREAITDGGRFEVVDPNGNRLADLYAGAAYASAHINGTLAVGDTDFAADDTITITVAEGSKKIKAAASAAVDGSAEVWGIMAETVDASAADAEGMVYTSGDFDENSLTLGAGLTVESIRETLAARGIVLKKAN